MDIIFWDVFFLNSTTPTVYTVQCECAIKVDSLSRQGAPGLVSASRPDVCARNDCCLCWCCGCSALSGRTNNIPTPHRSLKQPAKGFFHAIVRLISAFSFDWRMVCVCVCSTIESSTAIRLYVCLFSFFFLFALHRKVKAWSQCVEQ